MELGEDRVASSTWSEESLSEGKERSYISLSIQFSAFESISRIGSALRKLVLISLSERMSAAP